MGWLDGSPTECQPCERYMAPEHEEMTTPHECFAPFDGTHPCDGRVYFCAHCNKDHHSGGYNTCKGRRGQCPRWHPACALAPEGT